MRILKNIILASTVLSSAGFGASAVAQATARTNDAGKTPGDAQLVVVTGSHLRRQDLNTASPVATLTAAQATQSGATSVADLLQKLPQAASTEQVNSLFGSQIATGGSGVETLSLYGMGQQNTLVLLNGRRMGPAGIGGTVGAVDLNVLPLDAFQRVDVLLDGSSSIYGSDAVGGVVNYVTRTNADGFDLIVHGDLPFRSHGAVYTATLTGGKTFDRGYVSVLASYHEETGLRASDRRNTACAQNVFTDPTTGARADVIDSTTGTYKCYNLRNADVLSPFTGADYQYMPGFIPPADGVATGLPAGWVRVARAGHPDTYGYANYTSPVYDRQTVIEPVKTASLLLNGGYALSDTMQLYTELMANHRDSSNTLAAQIFSFLYAGNPQNTLSSSVGTVMPVVPYDIYTRTDVDYVRGVLGLTGTLAHAGPLTGFHYDSSYQVSYSSAAYGQSFAYWDRVYATTLPGSSCYASQMTVAPTPCVTIPWLSADVLAGKFTNAQRDFLLGYETGHTKYLQQTIEGNLSGDIAHLPAGAVSAVVGVFLQDDQMIDTPGYNAINDNYWGQTTVGITKGTLSSEQVYGEVYVPLVKDLPLVKALDLTVSGRFANYSGAGSDGTYKTGVVWNLTKAYAFTLTHGTSFRAPTIYESHLANQSGFSRLSDPCTDWAASNSALIRQRCAALGLSGTFVDGASTVVYTGGGPGLKPETATNTNLGFVWTPAWAELKVAVRYNVLDDKNKIADFGAQNIVDSCYAGLTHTAFFCNLVSRDSSGDLATVQDDYINIAKVKNRNVDLQLDYARTFPLGRLTVASDSSWQIENKEILGGETTDNTGAVGNPVFTNQTHIAFATHGWLLHWGMNLMGKASDLRYYGYSALQPASALYPNGYLIKAVTPFYQIHNVSVTHDFDKVRVTLGINNLFDVQAPTLSSSAYGEWRAGTAALNMYDLLGRSLYTTIDKRF